MSLKGKKILLAISGSIAAYKMPQLVRHFMKAGAEVKVVMTPSAAEFVAPLALSTVSKHTVLTDMFDDAHDWNNHVHLALWADLLLVAPASANTLARCAQGLCNNMVEAVYLSARAPVFFAPAMDEDMWAHPAVQNNVALLSSRGKHHFIPVAHGELASGLIGHGRMAELETIIDYVSGYFTNTVAEKLPVTALVTAGPTYENIDPVRFIGNHSSGKMGISVAHALAQRVDEVHLILGPGVDYTPVYSNISVYRVWSAQSMLEECLKHFPGCQIAVMTAAVADYRPKETHTSKIKKEEMPDMNIELVKNPDILYELGHSKSENQVIVGFALETDNEMENAAKKLVHKKADYIALNSLKDEYVGFGKDTSRITLLSAGAAPLDLGAGTKEEVAEKMINFILDSESERLK